MELSRFAFFEVIHMPVGMSFDTATQSIRLSPQLLMFHSTRCQQIYFPEVKRTREDPMCVLGMGYLWRLISKRETHSEKEMNFFFVPSCFEIVFLVMLFLKADKQLDGLLAWSQWKSRWPVSTFALWDGWTTWSTVMHVRIGVSFHLSLGVRSHFAGSSGLTFVGECCSICSKRHCYTLDEWLTHDDDKEIKKESLRFLLMTNNVGLLCCIF